MKEPKEPKAIEKLRKDAIEALLADDENSTIAGGRAGVSNRSSARMLVDLYYDMQEIRKRQANKCLAVDQGADPSAGAKCAAVILGQAETLEANAALYLEYLARRHVMWPWLEAVHGIGRVLASGLIAHLGARAVPPTVGHWWRYAGLDPSQQWLGADALKKQWDEHQGDIETRARAIAGVIGRDPETVIRDATTDLRTGEQKRITKASALKSLARIPYNRPLKTLCWKIGDQFVKLGSKEDAFYARWYRSRKAEEVARNERGERRALAERTLRKTPNHAQRAIYEQGLLPDGRVDLMARRATVKLFLSHLHELWWRAETLTPPPAPFSISGQGHGHYIAPPYPHAYPDADG